MVRLPQPLRARAIKDWPGRDSSDMPIFKHQPLLVVSLEGDWWVKVRSPLCPLNAIEDEWYVPRAFVEILDAVSGVKDATEVNKLYGNWVRHVENVVRTCVDADLRVEEEGRVAGEERKRVGQARGNGVKLEQKEEENKPRWIRPRVDVETFPFPPKEVCTCQFETCKSRKVDTGLGACKHDMEMLLKGAGTEYSGGFLWKESLRWHPDKWTRWLANDFVEGKRIVTELFVIIKALADEKREAEGDATGKK